MRYLFLLLTFAFTTELEVDGNLKVNGNIDAQNNPITNVGAPLTMSDAVNAGILESLIREDEPSEYKLVATKITHQLLDSNGSFSLYYKNYGESSWTGNFETYLNTLEDSGWYIHKIVPYIYTEAYQQSYNYYIFKRLIEENE